ASRSSLADARPTALSTLSLHDALPISAPARRLHPAVTRSDVPVGRASGTPVRHTPVRGSPIRHTPIRHCPVRLAPAAGRAVPVRSEEHTSELQSRENLVCRLLLEKKKK